MYRKGQSAHLMRFRVHLFKYVTDEHVVLDAQQLRYPLRNPDLQQRDCAVLILQVQVASMVRQSCSSARPQDKAAPRHLGTGCHGTFMTSQLTFFRSIFKSNSLGNFIVRISFFSCRGRLCTGDGTPRPLSAGQQRSGVYSILSRASKSMCSFASFTGGNSRAASHFVDVARILHCAHSLDARRHAGRAWPAAGRIETRSVSVQCSVSCCWLQRLSLSLVWWRSASQTICDRK